MGLKVQTDQDDATVVEEFIGTAYDVVRSVADHLSEIDIDANNIDDIVIVADSIDDVNLVAELERDGDLDAVITAVDYFDDTYLGAFAVAPALDNDGDPLNEGALYWDTVLKELRAYDGANWVQAAVVTPATLEMFEYTATEGQTVFSGADDNANTLSYFAGTALVSLNGVLLDQSDYTATNGTSITLGLGAELNDILSVIAFSIIELADVYNKTEVYAKAEVEEFTDGTIPITPDINGGTIGGVTVDGNLTTNGETITPEKLGFLNDVTSDLQAQMDANSGQMLGTAAIKAIAFNAQSISEDITIIATINAMSAGPILISDTYTITIENGAVWTII